MLKNRLEPINNQLVLSSKNSFIVYRSDAIKNPKIVKAASGGKAGIGRRIFWEIKIKCINKRPKRAKEKTSQAATGLMA